MDVRGFCGVLSAAAHELEAESEVRLSSGEPGLTPPDPSSGWRLEGVVGRLCDWRDPSRRG